MGRPSKQEQVQEVESTAPVDTEQVKEDQKEINPIQKIEISMGSDDSYYKNTGDVKFEYKDGRISIISKESADIFVKRGIGKIIK